MFSIVGHPVERLERVGFGPLSLGTLRPGCFRYLAKDEVEALKAALGMKRIMKDGIRKK
jgi:23S rRNA pseudouridine2605 synthase